jgi:hypothetical protein
VIGFFKLSLMDDSAGAARFQTRLFQNLFSFFLFSIFL